MKLSPIVSKQLPEFIRSEYPAFVEFIKAYYAWLEQQQIGNVESLTDIDDTVDSFLEYFRKELNIVGQELPYVDSRFFLRNSKQLFSASGSKESYKFLLKALFGKTADVTYPWQRVLKPSDGKWIQDVSIFIKIKYGTPEDVVGQYVTIEYPNKTVKVRILSYRTVNVLVDGEPQISPDTYQFFIDKSYLGTIDPYVDVKYSTVFKGTIQATTSSIRIVQPGKDFKIGQTYRLNSPFSQDSIIKVTKIDTNGGILSCELIDFGSGYDSNFLATILAQDDQNTAGTSTGVVISGPGGVTITNDNTGYLVDQGYINKADYNNDAPGVPPAIDQSYAGEVLATFFDTTQQEAIDSTDYAIISVTSGAVARYPGYFLTNDGFLDDSIVIQDSHYFGLYSYVIQIDEQLDKYGALVKNILHPAGSILFGEYVIDNPIQLSTQLTSVLDVKQVNITDSFTVTQTDFFKDFVKGLVDSITATDSAPVFAIDKPLDDTLDTSLFTESAKAYINTYIEWPETYWTADYSEGTTTLF